MCSLFGMSSAVRQRADHALLRAPRSVLSQSRRNPDGWGIAFQRRPWPDGGTAAQPCFVTVKQPATAAGSRLFVDTASRRRSTVILAHLRRRTIGGIEPDNTQPFSRTVALAHAGGIGGRWHYRLRRALGNDYDTRGATSGELLWAAIEHALLPADDLTEPLIERLLQPLLATPDGITSANFILGHADRLYAFRFAPAGRHRLFLLQRARSVLVSSVPLTDEPWLEIPERTLLSAQAGRYRLIPLAT